MPFFIIISFSNELSLVNVASH